MAAQLCIFACQNLRAELCACLAAEGWPDVVAAGFPACCGRPPLTWDEVRNLLPAGCTRVLLLGRACLPGLGTAPEGFPPVRFLAQEQCFNALASPTLVAEAVAEGSYLITPGWLGDWRGRLADLGFAPGEAGGFFREFARELLLLDTGVNPEAQGQLQECSRLLGLPARRLAVGIDPLRSLLARAVLEWRLEEEGRAAQERERRLGHQLADQALAMDCLARLARAHQESEAIALIQELFRTLFAPGVWHYLSVVHGRMAGTEEVPAEFLEAFQRLDGPHAWAPSGQGFLLRLARDEEVLGLVLADRLAFPEHRERYLNLALALVGVCALAIENARARRRLVEAEKMASMGIMVAGVAHEINTPVGIGLLAATGLEERSRHLRSRFTERTMTQADLRTYLEAASEEVRLIHANLHRIGQITDTMREMAVGKVVFPLHRFPMKACIDDVQASLARLLPPERIALEVRCAEGLEVLGLPLDWARILTNLINNSLQHGFKGREQGRIDIAVARASGRVELDYSDDGVGLAPEARAHIFDPFYSGDPQHGMGLGMNLVYNLVTQRLGGSITCASLPGQGVHFHLEVPQ